VRHEWGCGTDCIGVQVYDDRGAVRFAGVGASASVSRDGARVALVDAGHVSMVTAATLARFVWTAPASMRAGIPTGFAWRADGFLVSFYGARNRLYCRPLPPGRLTCVPG
jgi:hypothetical protein